MLCTLWVATHDPIKTYAPMQFIPGPCFTRNHHFLLGLLLQSCSVFFLPYSRAGSSDFTYLCLAKAVWRVFHASQVSSPLIDSFLLLERTYVAKYIFHWIQSYFVDCGQMWKVCPYVIPRPRSSILPGLVICLCGQVALIILAHNKLHAFSRRSYTRLVFYCCHFKH